MITSGQTLTNPVTGETLVFRTTSADTNGERVVVETFVEPNGAVAAAHVHPPGGAFEVLGGELEFRVGTQDDRREARRPRPRPGRDGPPVPEHRRRDGALRLRGAPGARLRAADRDDVLARRRRQGEPKGMPNPLRLAVIARQHFGDVRLPFPPVWMQRLGLAMGAPIGRLLGFRATYEPAAPEAPTALGF